MKRAIYLITLFIFLFSSCQKENINGTLDETIYVRHQGADMPAYVHGNSGNKTFLVAIHGAGSFGLSYRDENFINQLEKDYVVVYFDSRGQSMSQGHYRKPDDIIDLMASDVEALTKVLKHKYGDDITLFLMGHSLGGLITGKALLRERVQNEYSGWINVDGILDVPSVKEDRAELLYNTADDQIDLGNSVAQWKEIQQKLRNLDFDSDEAYSEILAHAIIAYDLIAKDEVVVNNASLERIYQSTIKNNPITWQAMHLFNRPENYAIDADYTILNELDQITIPTLFTYGKYDFSVPPSGGENAFKNLASTEKTFTLYQRTAHHPFVSEGWAFTQEVKAFIAKHR